MKRLLLSMALLIGSISAASATCTGPAVMHDFPGTAFNMSLATNAGDGNCAANTTIVGTVPLPTGAATAAGLTTINTTLGTPFQAGGSIGNTTFAVTNAGTFAVQLTGATNNINNIAGTISLPTGASTSANQSAIQAPVAAGAATATKSVLLGGQFDTTQKTLTNGQQGALSVSARGAAFVAVGADGFAVTNAGTFATQAAITAASGALASGSVASGAMVDLGAQADAAAAADNSTASLIALVKRTNQNITTLNTTAGAAVAAGTNVIGKVGIDQTTPGTTNLVALAANQSVNVAQVAGTTAATGSGVMGAGTQRMALATDSPGIVTLGQTTKSASVPMAIASDQVGTAGTANATVMTVQGIASMTPVIANSTNGYPTGAIAETASATGTTAATTATLATAVGKTTYICGFAIRANATAAATANSTVTGTITGTLNFTQWTAPLASGIGLTEERFSPCVPASATNTSIAVISAAPGSGGVVSVTAWGFQL